MKKLILLCLTISMTFAGCGKKQPTKNPDDEGRSLASVESQDSNSKTIELPVSARKFILNEEQRLKPQQAIKNYSEILPEEMYKRLLKLSQNVDDLGFSVTRKNNDMILSNGKQTLKIQFVGPMEHLRIVLDGQEYDFANAQSVERLLQKLERNILGTTKTAGISPLFKFCPALGLLSFADDSQASNWFLLGGLAILGVAIAFAAYTLGKSVKKTEHTVKGEVSLDQKSKESIDNLADAVKNAKVDVNLDTNHNIKVDIPKEATGLF